MNYLFEAAFRGGLFFVDAAVVGASVFPLGQTSVRRFPREGWESVWTCVSTMPVFRLEYIEPHDLIADLLEPGETPAAKLAVAQGITTMEEAIGVMDP